MISVRAARFTVLAAAVAALAGCGGGGFLGLGGGARDGAAAQGQQERRPAARQEARRSTIWDLFANRDDPNVTVEVNKYIWNAALEVLNFLPIEAVDPFTGVIVTGYGVPPGGGRAYRATVYIQDPALDARALKVALEARGGGPVAPEVVRAVEDAILTRARQLRIADSRL
jgi:predicted small lipoprotein YifL